MRPLLRVRVRGRQRIRLQEMHSQTHCARTRLHAQIVLRSQTILIAGRYTYGVALERLA
jgi:hypothetical protein